MKAQRDRQLPETLFRHLAQPLEAGRAVDDNRNAGAPLKGEPGLLRNGPAKRCDRDHEAHTVAFGVFGELVRLQHPALAVDIGEIGLIAACADRAGRRHKRISRHDGKRPRGSGPTRYGMDCTDQRGGSGGGADHTLRGQPQRPGQAPLQLTDQRPVV